MATESRSERVYLGRFVIDQNGDMNVIIPFVVSGDSNSEEHQTSRTTETAANDNDMIRVVLVNHINRSYTVLQLQGVSNLEALFGDLQSKAGQPPASKSSIEAMPEVEIEEDCVAECAICLDEMKVAKVMPCKHKFHGGCVEKWLRIHGSCPVCRFQMPAEERTSR